MIAVTDLLRPLRRRRLRSLARAFAPQIDRSLAHPQLVEQLAAQAGDQLLGMFVRLSVGELEAVATVAGCSIPELARLVAPPQTRGDCLGGLRPCPYLGCRYQAAAGRCVLDLADEVQLRGEQATFDEIADAMACSRQNATYHVRRSFARFIRALRKAGFNPHALAEQYLFESEDFQAIRHEYTKPNRAS